jgi:nitroreductase
MSHVQYEPLTRYDDEELERRSEQMYRIMSRRRSIRSFSSQSISEAAIKNCILTAGTAPSGANQQPWTFVLIKDADVKKTIRDRAEQAERHFYEETAAQEWKDVLKPLATGYSKPFLQEAPYLIAIFVHNYGVSEQGSKITHYYAQKSVGIATGFLVAALHQLGISTLTYTPSSMKFLNTLLKRPKNEYPYLLLAVGFAPDNATVPDIKRKTFDEIAVVM